MSYGFLFKDCCERVRDEDDTLVSGGYERVRDEDESWRKLPEKGAGEWSRRVQGGVCTAFWLKT